MEAISDGDTITGSIHLGWGVTLSHRKIRFIGFDAWEVSRVRRTVSISNEELRKGRLALDSLTRLEDENLFYLSIGEQEYDNYGRVLGHPYIQDNEAAPLVDLDVLMTLLGHARRD